MKMTQRDRLEATLRTPQWRKYQEALRKSYKETDPKKRLALFRNVHFPWSDPLEFQYFAFSKLPGFDEIKQALLKHLERKTVVLVTENEWPCGKDGPVPNRVWTWNKNRLFVRLLIDLNKSERELKKRFIEIVKAAREEMKQRTSEGMTTSKKREYDPWEIYDLRKKKELPLLEIARRHYGKRTPRGRRSPSNNKKLWPPYKGVERAYNQAEKMIQARSAEIESWYSKNRL